MAADALIASTYLAGTNTRRVRRALAAVFGGTVGKDTVSRVWRKVKTDWEAWNKRPLGSEPYDSTLAGEWTRDLLIRRNIADSDLAFFAIWCPKRTPIQKLVLVEGHRWAIADSFEAAKNELGLDHNESRSWHGWHRHVSLVMLAFAMMVVIRHRANAAPPLKKTMRRLRTKRRS